MVDQVESLDLVDDRAEQDCLGRVAHPRVELAIRLVRPQQGVPVVIPCSLRLLRECDDVGWGLQSPVFVCPEFACGPYTGLHLVNDHQHIMLLCDLTQASEICRGCVVVTTLGLDGLDDDGDDGAVPGRENALRFLKAPLFLCAVCVGVFL